MKDAITEMKDKIKRVIIESHVGAAKVCKHQITRWQKTEQDVIFALPNQIGGNRTWAVVERLKDKTSKRKMFALAGKRSEMNLIDYQKTSKKMYKNARGQHADN